MKSPGTGSTKLNLERNAQWPLYLRLCEELRRQVREGVLSPGDRLPSFSQLREEYGIHKATVERAHMILEKEGLVVRRSGAGTFVCEKPECTGRISKGVIGLCGYGFEHGGNSSYWMELLEGIRAKAEDLSAQVLLLPDAIGDGWEKVDGALISGFSHDHFVEQLPAQIPLTCLFAGHKGRASVVADEYAGMHAAVEHLLELGHTHIAYLHGQAMSATHPRHRAYHDALHQAGITPEKSWHRLLSGKNDYSAQYIQAGRRDMEAWLADGGSEGWAQIGCTALLCHNDETAFGVMQAFAAAGILIPRDVSIIGFDGIEIGQYSYPPLTSVGMPLREIGAAGVELLHRQITQDEVLSDHLILPTVLQVRGSTAAPSGR